MNSVILVGSQKLCRVDVDDDDDDVIGEEQNPMALSTEEKKGASAFKGPGDHMLAAPILEVDDDVESVISPNMQQVKYMAQ